MEKLDLGAELLEMIEKVIRAADERTALVALFGPLFSLFDMDQAAFCEFSEDGTLKNLFAMDSSRRILQQDQDVWLSKTLMETAIRTMAPAVHVEHLDMSDEVPKSIAEYSLKNVICIPISRSPAQVIYLASRRNPLREFSEEELSHLRIATRAAMLAFQQHHYLKDLKDGNDKLKHALESRKGEFLYSSQVMEQLMSEASRIARFNISILIQGESGTGKEELAKEIHRISGRTGPFIAVNCANLTETLLESELFGYVRGAFTGATASKKGLFQECEGGTFFLDEIAELPLNLQAKLLRVLQERTIRPLGSNVDLPVDIRILAASHNDLRLAVAQKKFREDLYYRIQEMTIHIPPLRERPDDIELLAHHFVTHFTSEFKLRNKHLGTDAIRKLLGHPWPGNVRELKNTCRTAVILSAGDVIQPVEIRLNPVILPEGPETKPGAEAPLRAELGSAYRFDTAHESANSRTAADLKDATRKFEREYIQSLLRAPGTTQAEIAQQLNISVRTLQRIINREYDS